MGRNKKKNQNISNEHTKSLLDLEIHGTDEESPVHTLLQAESLDVLLNNIPHVMPGKEIKLSFLAAINDIRKTCSKSKKRGELKKRAVEGYLNHYDTIKAVVTWAIGCQEVLEKIKRDHVSEIDRLKQNESHMQEKIKALKDEIEEQKQNESHMQEKIKAQIDKIEEQKQKESRLQEKIQAQKVEIEQHAASLKAIKQGYRGTEQQLKEKLQQQSERQLQDHKTKNEKQIQRLKRDIESKEAEFKEAASKLTEEIQTLHTEIDTKEVAFKQSESRYQTIITENEADIQKLKAHAAKSAKELKEEIQKLKTEIDTKEVTFKQSESRYQTTIAGNEADIQKLKAQAAKSAKDYKEIEHQQEKQIAKLQHEIRSQKAQLDELSTKLAAEMSTKLSADESMVENVSIKNRPMNVAEEYQLLCSNQWLEAKSVLDEEIDDEVPDYKKIQMLTHVIELSSETTKTVLQLVHNCVSRLFHDPVNFALAENHAEENESNSEALNKTSGQLANELTNMFGDMLRNSSDRIDLDKLVEKVISKFNDMGKDSPNQNIQDIWAKVKDQEDVHKYISDMVRVCWKMAIQRPQMSFQSSDVYEGEAKQELFWNSDQSDEPVVIEVYPMLYHGDSMMAKGKVLLLDPQKLQ